MTDRETLGALAERCEAASGPDAALDAAIGACMNVLGWHAADCLIRPTASLDAAMTLVPESFKVHEFEQQGAYHWRWRCWLLRPDDAEGIAHAWEPAIALTAAALRARAATLPA